MSNKLRRKTEKAMFRQVMVENEREKDGTAADERVMVAMEYIMEPGQTVHNPIASILAEMLGKEAFYSSKAEMWEEAMNRLYPQEPETDSDDTIVVDLESD